MKLKWAILILTACVLPAAAARAQSWETNFERAASRARVQKKHMLLDFSGSDWCGWCHKLDREVFQHPAFKNYARDNLVCVVLDFPRNKKQSRILERQNQELAQKYGVRGYPTVIILDPAGNLVGKTGYRPGGAEAYVEHLRSMIGAP
ncbi:MAG TPA: thioredoxin family protein [bacterium]|nr:thioredoxin family protein [bacterium]HPJ71462.1 thioredoxin family protein [bacterium]HPQ66046.1 thioredoxin family protein [bacterium]